MTGSIKIHGVKVVRYRRSIFKQDEEWPPKFYKLILKFNDGVQLAFTDSRRFARIRLVDDPLATPPVSELGVDAFSELPPPNEFAALFSKRTASIKSVLLDQHTLAGVGNWVADEVLCQARIHPEQAATSLTREQFDALHHSLRTVLKTAVELDAESEKFPKNWLFHYRWDRLPGKVNGHQISYATVAKRTTAFIPELQKKVGTGKVNGTRGGSRAMKGRKRTAIDDVSVNLAEEPVERLKLRSMTGRKRRASEEQQDSTVKEDGSPGVETRGKRVRGTEVASSGKAKDENAGTGARTTPKRTTPRKTKVALRSAAKLERSSGVGTRGKRGSEAAVAGSGRMDEENAETDTRTRGTPGKTNMALRSAAKEGGNPGGGTRSKRARETASAAGGKMDDGNSETDARATPGKMNMALRNATKEDGNPGGGTRGKRVRETAAAAASGKMDDGNLETDARTTPGKMNMALRSATKEGGNPVVGTRAKRAGGETGVATSAGKMDNINSETEARTTPSRGGIPEKMNMALRSATKEDATPGVGTRGKRPREPPAAAGGKMDEGNAEAENPGSSPSPRRATPVKANMTGKEDGSPGVETRGKRAREVAVAASRKMGDGNPETDSRTTPWRGTPGKPNMALRSAVKEDGSPGIEMRGGRRSVLLASRKMDEGNGEIDATALRGRQGKVNMTFRKHSKQEKQPPPGLEEKMMVGKNDTRHKGRANSKHGGGSEEAGRGKVAGGKKTSTQDVGKGEDERTAPAVLDKNSKETSAKRMSNKRSSSAEQDAIIIETKEDVNANKSATGGAIPQLQGRTPPRGVKKQSSASQEESMPRTAKDKAKSNGVQKQRHDQTGKVSSAEIKKGGKNSAGKDSRTRARFVQGKETQTIQQQRQDVKEQDNVRCPLTTEMNKIGGDADGVGDEGRRRSARVGTKKA